MGRVKDYLLSLQEKEHEEELKREAEKGKVKAKGNQEENRSVRRNGRL